MPDPEDNFRRMMGLLDKRVAAERLDINEDEDAKTFANEVPLSHCTAAITLSKIWEGRKFISKQQRTEEGDWPSHREHGRGTLDDVFFYLASVRFPVSPGPAGILFKRRIQEIRPDARVCPFDTGALGEFFSLPGSGTLREQIEDHEVLLPKSGEFLLKWINVCHENPANYLDGKPIRCASPIGLAISDSKCDERAWTFEARFAKELILDNDFVEAVFIQDERITSPKIVDLADWAESLGKLHVFEVPHGDDQNFTVLKQESRAYIDSLISKAAAA